MKNVSNILGGLLGLVFFVFGLNFFLKFLPMPPFPEGSPAAAFMGAMVATGYLAFVKVLEIAGAVLVALPKTRVFGLLILGPIVVNILAFHIFLLGGAGLLGVPLFVAVLALVLAWLERGRLFGCGGRKEA
ncbi:MAG: hypothetical protein D6781_01005 [Verrucomicrobia bacterium]|nr:MAG: hypothetical protein D6781_01005 [Verrucomicrobiota bacterium]